MAETVERPNKIVSDEETLLEELKKDYDFKASFKTWKHASSLKESEENILSMLDFYPEGDESRRCETMDVDIGSGNSIHEFCIENTKESDRDYCRDMVLVHGYGAALGLFIRNFDGLSQIPGIRLHAIDMLGYGMSSRPKFPGTGFLTSFWKKREVTKEDVLLAEDFFIDSIETWRHKRHLDKFVLVGHSLGGYLSCRYALKYPERVEKLILVSPVGVETSIFDLTKKHTATHEHAAELGPDVAQELKVVPENSTTDKPVQPSSSFHVPNESGHVERIPNLPKIVRIIWENNISPFGILRSLGPWGPLLCSRWSFRRFSHCGDKEQVMKFHDYAYNTFNARGSGEYALTRILAPGVLARIPLLSCAPKNLKCESLWMYGSHDWMSKEAGSVIVKELNKAGNTADYSVVSDAGHHLYLDNPHEFNQKLRNFLNV